jgi:hypothetical protein
MSLPMSRVRIDPEAAVRVTFDPYSSVLALACSGVRDRLRGHDTGPARVAARFSERGIRALSRIVAPGASVSPDCISPSELGTDTDVAAEVSRLRGMSADDVHRDLDQTFAGNPPPHWERISDAPDRWARDVADALDTLWTSVEPVWQRENGLRTREAERIGNAAVRRAMSVVLSQAHPRGHIEGDTLVFPDPEGTELDMRGKPVVLAPVLSKLDLSICNLERPDLVWFAYPVADRSPRTADPGGLAALLTPMRAGLLRMLDGEWSMSQVAAGLGVGASAATHQVDALVSADLVTRRREGRRTLIHRTERGNGLLDLYDGAF